ncbi:MAG: ATP-binding protein [Lactobacillaceae bacterium]|jgi:hypothetical protein|nr:ATP-binding protein [Lactobacillaceae bacterium]
MKKTASTISRIDDSENNPFTTDFRYEPKSYISNDNHSYEKLEQGLTWKDKGNRNLTLTSIRGTGKTSTLQNLKQRLDDEYDNVVTIFVNSDNQILDNILSSAINALPSDSKKDLEASATFFGVLKIARTDKFDKPNSYQASIQEVLNQYEKNNIQLVVFIDEIQHVTDELRILFGAQKTIYNENGPMMIISAGLPSIDEKLKTDPALSFLLRSRDLTIGNLSNIQIADKYRSIFKEDELSNEQIERLSKDIQGYPYLYQLVGYEIWNSLLEKKRLTLNKF